MNAEHAIFYQAWIKKVNRVSQTLNLSDPFQVEYIQKAQKEMFTDL